MTSDQSGFVIPVITPSGPTIAMPTDLEDPQSVLGGYSRRKRSLDNEIYQTIRKEDTGKSSLHYFI